MLERHGTAAEGASFATGGLAVPDWPTSLGDPPGWRSVFGSIAAHPGSLRLGAWPGDSAQGCLRHHHRSSRSPGHQARQAALFQLVRYSQHQLSSIADEHQLSYDNSQGVLLLWRQECDATPARAALPALRELGLVAREIDAQRARQIEPALSGETTLYSVLEPPDAQGINARPFTLLLKNIAQQQGCQFGVGSGVTRLNTAGPGFQLFTEASSEALLFDHVVVCAGSESDRLLRPLGLTLPLQPFYGHSISAAIHEPLDARCRR